MNTYHKTHLRRQVMQALKWMDARQYQIIREEKDVNGAPTGHTAEVCILYGVTYSASRNMDALLMAIPGITLENAHARRLYGLIITGGMPEEGDQAEGMRILDVQDTQGIVTLKLEG